jgi:uncharacterized protein (DUF2147 family)
MSKQRMPRVAITPVAVLLIALLSLCGMAIAERSAVDGVWLTDRGDGAVELKPCGNELCGTVYSIIRLPDPSRPPIDARNEQPERRSRPLCGMPIIGGMRKLGPDKWGEGWIYDPHVGKTYGAELTLQNPNVFAIYGYVGSRLIGRTVLWTRADGQLNKCSPRN